MPRCGYGTPPVWSMAAGVCQVSVALNTNYPDAQGHGGAIPGHSGTLRLSSPTGVGRLSEIKVTVQ